MSSHRLASGGLIDRAQPLSFSFDGQTLLGLCRRYARLGADRERRQARRPLVQVSSAARHSDVGSEEPNALVELRTGARREPNTRATTRSCTTGLSPPARTAGRRSHSMSAQINDALARFLPAGFYYKTFMWPAKFWEAVYEPLIRRAAGLGRAAGAEDPDHYEKAFAHCDVLVIGAGPAGLMAALAAGRSGARVILADEDFRLGGRLLAERYEIDGKPGVRMGRAGRGRARIDARRAHHAPHHRDQCVRSRPVRGDRARQRSCAPAAGARAAPAALEDRGEARRAGGRRARADDCLRQQRSPRRDAGERGAYLCQPLRRDARTAPRGLHQQ